MRPLLSAIALTLLCAFVFACSSESSTPNGLETKSAALQSGGHDVLKLTVAFTTKATPKPDSLNLRLDDNSVDIWLVPSAPTVDDCLARVPDVIKDEFKKFTTTGSKPMTIAGANATHLMGSGEEADDGDNGTADVIVFKVGDHVFVACTHGESLTTGAQQWMMTVVQTAQKP